MTQLIPVILLAIFVGLFGLAIVVVSSLLGPKLKQSKTKLESYECGLEESKSESTKIPIKFYLTAILFILFDIEIIFMYPWALTYGDFIEAGQGLYLLVAMGIFLLVFVFGLFWEIKSRALEWE